ncbi:EAL domain-containing protein [Sulfurihydrogenibium sp.]|uniref:EAL domain-containing protein n=1 Tax=Sulfurihydrogenibium sp. TaxID=2053621 RepID=UPI003D0A62BE
MLRFIVCPHDVEFEEGRNKWYKFSEELSKVLNQQVNLDPFSDYYEELIKTDKNTYDITFSDIEASYQLYKKGYIPVARLKGHNDKFLIVGFKDKIEENSTIATSLKLTFHVLPILKVKEIYTTKTRFKVFKSQKEIYEAVKNGEVDFGILYKDSFDYFNDKDLRVVEEIETNFYHYIMVKPDLYEKVVDAIKNFPEFEVVSEEEFLKSLYVSVDIQGLMKVKEAVDITILLLNSSNIGLVIYTEDKILLKNRFMEEVLSDVDSLENLFSDRVQEVKETLKDRKNGKYFYKIYDKVKLKNRYFTVIENTMFFIDTFVAASIFVDITEKVKLDSLYRTLKYINQAIMTSLTEEELYDKVCKTIVDNLFIKFVWIGVPDYQERIFKSIYKCGKDEGYLDVVRVSTDFGITGRAFHEGRIVINQNTKVNPFVEPWREEMLKRNFLSSAAIPIFKNDKVFAVLTIHASEENFFDEQTLSILDELQKDLSFALEKIDDIRESIILKIATENTSWILITDKYGNIEYVNDYVVEVSGYTKEELIGKNPKMFKSGLQDKDFYKKLWETILSGKSFEAVFVNRKKNGELFYLEQKIMPINLPGGVLKFISIGRDITRERLLSEEVEKIRYFDPLTGLYNLNGFLARAYEVLNKFEGYAVLLILNISKLSFFNKFYGIEFGDKIIKEFARRIRENVKKTDIVARIGGDWFAVMFLGVKDKRNIPIMIERIRSVLLKDFYINNQILNVKFVGGIAVHPDDGSTFDQIFENANIALRSAKSKCEGCIEFFSKDLEKQIQSLFLAERIVSDAIKYSSFIFHYQPYFEVKSGKVAGFESLVRIRDINGYIYYPKDFIDFLENSVYLKDFEEWALKEISEKIKIWQIPISINISARTFEDNLFLEEFEKYLKDLPVSPVIEITERLYIKNIETTKKIVSNLRNMNVKIAIDDFGTGYSSLSSLKDIDVDILKIDMSFVKAMVNDKKSRALVKTIISIAQDFGMKTLAEGVETQQQKDILVDMGVDYLQGFLLSKPLPEEEVEKIIGGNL